VLTVESQDYCEYKPYVKHPILRLMRALCSLDVFLNNPNKVFFKRVRDLEIKEALFSGTLDAVGHVQQRIWKYAHPKMISRRIISTEKKESIERFPLAVKAVAYSHAEGTVTRFSGTKTIFVAVDMDKYVEASEQWTHELAEWA
jgi:hypothetical protein